MGFSRGRTIDMGFDSNNEMMFATLGIKTEGPIDLVFDSGSESRVSINITKRELPVARL